MENFRLNEQLARLRRARGVTQEELAQALGVTNQAVSKWESAQCCPDIQLLPDIAAFFGVSVDQLMGVRNAAAPDRLPLQLRAAIDDAQAGDDAKLALRLAYTLHATLFSKEMQSDGNPGWNSDDVVAHAAEAEWGLSCVARPGITTRMRYGSVFFSDNHGLHLDHDKISTLCHCMHSLSTASSMKTFAAVYTLTVDDAQAYASAAEIAQCAGLREAIVSEQLEGKLAGYLSSRSGEGVVRYRVGGKFMHIVPLLAMICNP